MGVRLLSGWLGGPLARRSRSQRTRRFPSEEAARAFDEALSEVSPASRRSGTARQDGCDRIHRVAYENVLIDRDGSRWLSIRLLDMIEAETVQGSKTNRSRQAGESRARAA